MKSQGGAEHLHVCHLRPCDECFDEWIYNLDTRNAPGLSVAGNYNL